MPAHWSDKHTSVELTKLIRQLAREGYSAQAVAEKIGHGTTKNMVASFAHRARPQITFSSESEAKRREAKAAFERVAEKSAQLPAVVSRLKFVIVDEIYEPIHQLKLKSNREAITDSRCRMPLWPDRLGSNERVTMSELMYCGKKTGEGSSWCEDCRRRVFQPAPTPVSKGEGVKRDQTGRRKGWEYGT